MNKDQKKTYLAWLNDAHAMEMGLITMLESMVKDTEDKPAMQTQLREHLKETRRHVDLIEECVKRNGGKVSLTKVALSKAVSFLGDMQMNMTKDERVKSILNAYAVENMEIASYTAVRAAAEIFDDNETVEICDNILEDERDMAEWLLDQLPLVVEEEMEAVG